MLFIQLERTAQHQPYYLQIVEQVRHAILSNELLPGSRLPPTRQLARELGISRRTVVVAYEELCAQGYCTSHVGQGTIVAEIPVVQKENEVKTINGFPQWLSEKNPTINSKEDDSETISFTPGLPQIDYLSVKAMRQAFQRVINDFSDELAYHQIPALKSEDGGGRVIYMGTFSKVLFNSLRLGYIVAHPKIIQHLVELRWQLDGGTSNILQLWVAELIESGALERHLRRMRVHYRKKRDLIANYLKQIFTQWNWQLPSGGLQFWIELPPNELAETVIHSLKEKGIGLYSGANYYDYLSQEATHRLILGFGAVTKTQIHQAFNRLKD